MPYRRKGWDRTNNTQFPLQVAVSAYPYTRFFILSLYRLSYLPHGAGAGFEPATSGIKIHRWLQNTFLSKRFLSALTTELSGSCMKSGHVPPAAAICVRRRHESRHFRMPFFLRSVSYPRFVLFRYAAIPPSAAPVRFPLEITPSSSRKGIAEDSAPFSPGRSFTFQGTVVNSVQTIVRKIVDLSVDTRSEIV